MKQLNKITEWNTNRAIAKIGLMQPGHNGRKMGE